RRTAGQRESPSSCVAGWHGWAECASVDSCRRRSANGGGRRTGDERAVEKRRTWKGAGGTAAGGTATWSAIPPAQFHERSATSAVSLAPSHQRSFIAAVPLFNPQHQSKVVRRPHPPDDTPESEEAVALRMTIVTLASLREGLSALVINPLRTALSTAGVVMGI